MEKLEGLRAVLTQKEHDFGKLMSKVLSPSQPLQSEEFLKGRSEQLKGLRRALVQPGRHALIHGLRGVGKSSLAQTGAFSLPGTEEPILIGCDEKSTFSTLIREVFDHVAGRGPAFEKKITEKGLTFARFGISAHGTSTIEEGKIK